MKNCMAVIWRGTSGLALSLLLVGCAHEVSHTKTSKVSSDGTVTTSEKTVTQSPDGSVTRKEEYKSTRP